MARTYAGILGPLALVTSVARGFVHAASAEAILLGAWCSLLVFAALGCVIGWIAGRIVQESVRATVRGELAQDQTNQKAEAAAA